MTTEKSIKIINALLSAISLDPENGLQHSFMYNRPKDLFQSIGTGIDIYYNTNLTQAAVIARNEGPEYFKLVSIERIKEILTKFIVKYFYIVESDVYNSRSKLTFDKLCSLDTKNLLFDALINSAEFIGDSFWTFFPLRHFNINSLNKEETVFFWDNKSDSIKLGASDVVEKLLDISCFVPLIHTRWRKRPVSGWLIVNAPDLEIAAKNRSILLAAASLKMNVNYRYMFSGAETISGYCSFQDSANFQYSGEPHVPALMERIIIGPDDQPWILKLNIMLCDYLKYKFYLNSLEYYYKTWRQSKEDRAAGLFMTLDALYGESNQATAAVVGGIVNTLEAEHLRQRISDIMRIRASVIHGGAPNVYETNKYQSYLAKYNADPLIDLDLVVAFCLRKLVFGDVITPNQNLRTLKTRNRGNVSSSQIIPDFAWVHGS